MTGPALTVKAPPPAAWRWGVLVAISVAMFGNYYTYDSVAPVADSLQRLLHYSDTQIGTLNAIYSFPNIVMVLIGGVIVDRFGTRLSTLIFGVICLIGAGITASSPSFPVMAAGRLVFGLGAESMIVAITVAIGQWFVGRQLGFAFGVNLNVVAKFMLREGMVLTEEQVKQIETGEVRQECFDQAMGYIEGRLHSRKELHRKLMRREYGEGIINGVLDDLERLGYVDDARFAQTKALSAAQYKQHGRRRAYMELLKSGVKSDVADKALNDVYEQHDSLSVVRELARKKAGSLKRLDPQVARRRLVGMLQRRGFDYESIKPVVDEVLGGGDEPPYGE